MISEPKGYAHPRYAKSLREFGDLRELRHCGGWIIVRSIPGTPDRDAMGCYPLFACRDWSQLHRDLAELQGELISLVLVTDPFRSADQAYLNGIFQVVRPFKKHLIADLTEDPRRFVNRHHQYYARRSLKDLRVEVCLEPLRYADEWMSLYLNLVKKHRISGLRTFSRKSFEAQMQTPGFIFLAAKLGGEVVGGHLVAIQDDIAYSHLTAFSDLGYKIRTSYGLYWETIRYLKERGIRFFDLGAGAGLGENEQSGLSIFKKGWSNRSMMTHLCGRIYDPIKYRALCRQNPAAGTGYFPAYRAGEFS